MNLSWILPFPIKQDTQKQKPKYYRFPGPDEIIESDRPKKRFQGLRVAWKLTIQSVHAQISQTEIMLLASFEDRPGNIWLTVDTAQFPDVFYYSSGSSILVKGEIDSVVGQDITLKNCRVKQ